MRWRMAKQGDLLWPVACVRVGLQKILVGEPKRNRQDDKNCGLSAKKYNGLKIMGNSSAVKSQNYWISMVKLGDFHLPRITLERKWSSSWIVSS